MEQEQQVEQDVGPVEAVIAYVALVALCCIALWLGFHF